MDNGESRREARNNNVTTQADLVCESAPIRNEMKESEWNSIWWSDFEWSHSKYHMISR